MNRFQLNVPDQTSGLPYSTKRIWHYIAGFWIVQAGITLVEFTLRIGISPYPMLWAGWVQWVLHWLLWMLLTPFLIYMAQRFPMDIRAIRWGLVRTILIHLLAFSVLTFLLRSAEYLLIKPLYYWETGKDLSWNNIPKWFVEEYSWGTTLYLLVLVLYNIFLYDNRYQRLEKQHLATELTNSQLKAQLTDAQLQALKMQLNPHFLFNTHHAIVSLMLQHDNRRAIDMVTALSDLLRGVLAHQDDNFLRLREELKLTQQYLAIQQIRFQDRLQIEYDIDPRAEDSPVPQLILQPLVENAVTHGIADLTDGARIRIAARRVDDCLLLEVFDNGVGNQPRKKRVGGNGLGLSNTRSRLHQAYGERARLTFVQPPGNGTTVALTLPCLSDSVTTTKNNEPVPLTHY
ncbi:histidine kinase/DNA gyrase B/HSP90-like ATPase [Larkinella arboricola]|uniref:histidine kinase n=1 Tax=Larkinella arboricola TaxID=643671 RepID=A0A327X7G4_LARAB|nr:histidine kinase [Larkinella arboricola]RAK03080.1 histidine kinase/DNA gyrase B/HSP90-like ATPase [Larkinella arboricola]